LKFPFSKGEKIQISGGNEVSRGRVFPSWAYPVGSGLIAAGLAFVFKILKKQSGESAWEGGKR
jgi:hypothetical protein